MQSVALTSQPRNASLKSILPNFGVSRTQAIIEINFFRRKKTVLTLLSQSDFDVEAVSESLNEAVTESLIESIANSDGDLLDKTAEPIVVSGSESIEALRAQAGGS